MHQYHLCIRIQGRTEVKELWFAAENDQAAKRAAASHMLLKGGDGFDLVNGDRVVVSWPPSGLNRSTKYAARISADYPCANVVGKGERC